MELIDVTLPGVSFVYNSSTNTNTATLSNLTIRFVGDFDVNSLTDVVFENCILNFAPGTGINIEADHFLTLDNSKLFACQSLWDGIWLNYNAKINTMNSTHIEDAKIAIHSPNTANLSITDTRFNRNEIGICWELDFLNLQTILHLCFLYYLHLLIIYLKILLP